MIRSLLMIVAIAAAVGTYIARDMGQRAPVDALFEGAPAIAGRQEIPTFAEEIARMKDGDTSDTMEANARAASVRFAKLAETYPKDPQVHLALGLALRELKDYRRAEPSFRKVLDLTQLSIVPSDRLIRDMAKASLAATLFELGRRDEARSLAKDYCSRKDRSPMFGASLLNPAAGGLCAS